MRTRPWFLAGSVAIAIALAGCSGGAVSTPAATSTPVPTSATASAAPSPTDAPAIVGEWVGIHDCERIFSMLTDAGLDEFALEAVYGNELIPGVTTPEGLKDPANPCDGAVDRQHSHFFTAGGEFGSREFHGQQVDQGTYSLEGDDVVVINGARFKYEIDGDSLSLEPEPVDISACTTRECRFGATWVLMVALPGAIWTRGEISPS